MITGTLLAFFHAEAPAKASQRMLTFPERVAYQRAIEDVYWRHRIWPRERPEPKPSLDAVMSQAKLENKVTDYLRKSQALEDYWQRPITGEQLQAEMDRMSKHTKQPEVLGELFAALGNDPFVVAECVARPALADRLLRNWYARDPRIHGELRQRAEADLLAHPAVEQMKQTSGTYNEIELVRGDSPCGEAIQKTGQRVKLNSFEWEQTVQKMAATFCNHSAALQTDEAIPIGVLSQLQEDETRYYTMAVISKNDDRLKLATVAWHKEPLELWLARLENQPAMTVAAGVSYSVPKISDTADSCIDDTWTALPGPPDGRVGETVVWTGSEMIIWGGGFGTGGRYVPTTDNWTPTTNTNAPSSRSGHTAIWTGSEMIVWGGWDGSNDLNTGGRYNPSTDSWTATTTFNAPAGRDGHTAVWTGNEMIIWSGGNGGVYLRTGGRYSPHNNSWTAINSFDAPAGRAEHTAVWTGSEMIVWGGYGCCTSLFNTGGRYNPSTNSWTATSTINAPSARDLHTAIWTGTQMIVWGGTDFQSNFETGGRYNPNTDSWTATSTSNVPTARSGHTAVWTGSNEMIVWGGGGDGGLTNSGGKYNPGTDSWTITSTINAPIPRELHVAVWTGSEMLVWGGVYDQSNTYSDDGGRYDPATDSWVPMSTGNTPAARSRHTAVWTGTEMIVWGGQLGYDSYLNTGGRYTPSIDNWSATSTTEAPSARDLHTAIWTGAEMIVWGGNEFGFPLNTGAKCNAKSVPSTPTPTPTPPIPATGGRYDPASDTWRLTSTINAPSVRWRHTAVWTGTEMIVWGGSYEDMYPRYYNSGGRYNPITDSWSGTDGPGVPEARDSHSAVWTGTEMIVWGGYYWYGNDHYLNTGGRFNPVTGIWTDTSATSVPTARRYNTAVWTGNEMIIWGGYDGASYLNTGGRYNPSLNEWTATNTTNAPTARFGHTAVWNDSEMIIWGGASTDPPSLTFNTGGKYNPRRNDWTPTSLTGAPAERSLHAAIWTGNEMIVWGGEVVGAENTHTGARYCAQFSPRPAPTPRPRRTPAPRP